ncbi:hypothetical protein I3843_07G124800 [Carya illinoinensis]|uniref:BHLH domain-containing protein n=2 Tax=Carya illinoinensis TaxID=32201 RepID=A0A922EIG5_CARIL|nr:transcription factor PHYTOCHROME INTERACTING FACTOR-LIKE 15-like isoform X1 [Carya illinoinensis]XP_042990049.1 transcription factor PHYTOCHROME INTERACTING FACTOR-LIKE 15-like isoform X1 [Carya illinoinensis]XP_042990050.1 transcription factor PHYTOCHROME INTERACTING FACTOR-LIKE 15-like isoform X1 [Carya illinoinensis]KAG2697874.1 hypothetical protein I3760_07G125600 [Carya illinoinensis]KAG2697875.1 hypothetical protein I3760_07G125600 [Carya illinoinensis]KAG2697876.1 hypothetical protei
MLESTRPRMTCRLPTLAPMFEDDCVELVWEDGQILMRGRSGRAQKGHSCTGYSLSSSNAQAENGENMHTKKARLETICSTLNDTAFLGILGRRDSDLNSTNNNNSSQTGYHLESLPQLYKFNWEDNKGKSEDKNSKHSKPFQEPELATFAYSRASETVLGPKLNSSKTLLPMGTEQLTSTLPESDSQPDKKYGAVKISCSRSAAILKANSQSSGVTRPTSSLVFTGVQETKGGNDERPPPLGGRNALESTVIERATASKSETGIQNQAEAELLPPVAKTKESLPREHPEAFGNQTSSIAENTRKGKTDGKILTKPPVTSSSVCSLGASNDPTYSLRRTYEETESSAGPSENVEEPQGLRKQAPGRSCTGGKRSRTAEVHNLSERRRRDKINKRMRVLKELIPNCNKVDKASMLDEAIEYLKTLQLQLQIMSMGNGVCMHPMMLPTAMQHINAAHLTHFSAMGAGMGMRMGMGMGCSPVQFSTSQVGANALPGITGTSFQMLGFPGQAFPMPVSHPSFIPSLGSQPIQSVLAHGISGASPLVEHLGSVSLTGSEDFSQNIYSEKINHGNTESSKIQTSSLHFPSVQ